MANFRENTYGFHFVYSTYIGTVLASRNNHFDLSYCIYTDLSESVCVLLSLLIARESNYEKNVPTSYEFSLLCHPMFYYCDRGVK